MYRVVLIFVGTTNQIGSQLAIFQPQPKLLVKGAKQIHWEFSVHTIYVAAVLHTHWLTHGVYLNLAPTF